MDFKWSKTSCLLALRFLQTVESGFWSSKVLPVFHAEVTKASWCFCCQSSVTAGETSWPVGNSRCSSQLVESESGWYQAGTYGWSSFMAGVGPCYFHSCKCINICIARHMVQGNKDVQEDRWPGCSFKMFKFDSQFFCCFPTLCLLLWQPNMLNCAFVTWIKSSLISLTKLAMFNLWSLEFTSNFNSHFYKPSICQFVVSGAPATFPASTVAWHDTAAIFYKLTAEAMMEDSCELHILSKPIFTKRCFFHVASRPSVAVGLGAQILDESACIMTEWCVYFRASSLDTYPNDEFLAWRFCWTQAAAATAILLLQGSHL